MGKRYACVGKHGGHEAGYCEECLAKQVIIDRMKEEMALLKGQLGYRKRKAKFSPLFGSSTPSSKIEIKENTLEENQKKVGGRKTGHPGTGRKLFSREEAKEIIPLKVELHHCPECGSKLEGNGSEDRCIIDAVITEAYRVIYECQQKRCTGCRKEVSRRPTVLPKSKYGNGLISNALVMHYVEGIPVNQVAKIFGISRGALLHIFHKLAKHWEPALDPLKKEYQEAPVKHADETGWRTDGRNGYAWLFCTPDMSLFKFGETRSGEVPREILGSAAQGVLVVDRYAGYNQVSCSIQYCYAHLLRDLQDLEKANPEDKEVALFVQSLAPLFAKAMGLRRTDLSDDEYYTQAKDLQLQITQLCKADSKHLGIGSYQSLFIKQEHRLFHWVTNRAIPPDNNRAERELRPTVISRKNSFGSQSPRGAKTRSILMTVLHTGLKRLKKRTLRHWILKNLKEFCPGSHRSLFLDP